MADQVSPPHSTDKQLRKVYLEKLNTVVDLARTYLGKGFNNYRASTIREVHGDLVQIGRVTNLKQVAIIERIGWRLIDMGGYAGFDDVGTALARTAEHYASRYPIRERDMADADDFIEELRQFLPAETGAIPTPEPAP